MGTVTELRPITRDEALDVLIRNFDIADVNPGETLAAIQYNQEKISAARIAINSIPDDATRQIYEAWLGFFQRKTDAAKS